MNKIHKNWILFKDFSVIQHERMWREGVPCKGKEFFFSKKAYYCLLFLPTWVFGGLVCLSYMVRLFWYIKTAFKGRHLFFFFLDSVPYLAIWVMGWVLVLMTVWLIWMLDGLLSACLLKIFMGYHLHLTFLSQ